MIWKITVLFLHYIISINYHEEKVFFFISYWFLYSNLSSDNFQCSIWQAWIFDRNNWTSRWYTDYSTNIVLHSFSLIISLLVPINMIIVMKCSWIYFCSLTYYFFFSVSFSILCLVIVVWTIDNDLLSTDKSVDSDTFETPCMSNQERGWRASANDVSPQITVDLARAPSCPG